jgi:hypothetical protein
MRIASRSSHLDGRPPRTDRLLAFAFRG